MNLVFKKNVTFGHVNMAYYERYLMLLLAYLKVKADGNNNNLFQSVNLLKVSDSNIIIIKANLAYDAAYHIVAVVISVIFTFSHLRELSFPALLPTPTTMFVL